MPRNKDEPPAVRVYTVCDESRYLIVRNVPALGCGEELSKLFSSYGPVEDCKPMDAEECEPFTDVYWIKFQHVDNARFAKRKLDDFIFLGNQLQVSYAPQFESLSDTKEKLEGRRKEVLARIKSGRVGSAVPQISSGSHGLDSSGQQLPVQAQTFPKRTPLRHWDFEVTPFSHVSSNKDYFSSPSMNEAVRVVREKLDKISSSAEYSDAGPALKKKCTDNRRRI